MSLRTRLHASAGPGDPRLQAEAWAAGAGATWKLLPGGAQEKPNIRVTRHLRGQAELGPKFRQGFSCATANEDDPRRTEGAATCSERLAPCMLTAFSVNA